MVIMSVVHGDSLGLYGDAPFALDLEFVEKLGMGMFGDSIGDFK